MILELCAIAALAKVDKAPVVRLVAVPKASHSEVAAAVGTRGDLIGTNPDGFLKVKVAATPEGRAVITALKKKWQVFEPEAAILDRSSLPSTRRHVAYLKAGFKMRGNKGENGESGVDFYEALEYYLERRVGPDGKLDKDGIEAAVKHRDQMPEAFIPKQSSGGNTPSGSASFSYVGPKSLDVPYNQYYGVQPLAGRVNGIAYAPSNPEVVYLATAGGGVWKSTDSGSNWSFKSGSTSSWTYLHTTCVDVHPDNENIVLVGTGDYYGFFTAQTQGIKRSTDGGSTWTTVGSAQFGNNIVTRVMFHPDNNNVVIALTAGATGDIWRSTDGGVTWAATNAPSGNWDDIDFCVSSGGSRALWAVGGNSESGGRIYRSTNQGSTWTAVSEPTTSTQTIMDVACSKSVAGKVWVLCPGGNEMFRTTNSGSSWTDLNLSSDPGFPNALGSDSDYNWSQDTYDLYVEASAFGGTEYLFCGLITTAVSTDNGNNWTNLTDSYSSTNSYGHNDQHCLEANPANGSIVILGSDGGVQRWMDMPAPLGWSYASLNSNLYNTQFYAMAVHPTSYSTYVMGGTQDNASPASRGNMTNWDNLYAGDGGWCAFNPSSPGTHYTTAQNGAVFQYTSAGDTSASEISPSAGWSDVNFIAPLVIANSGANLLIGANNSVMRYQPLVGWFAANSFGAGNDVNTMAVGISNTDRVYAGCDDGDLWRSDNGGITFTEISNTLPNSTIGGVACSWASSTDVIVGLQRSTGGLYRCSNTTAASPTWTSLSGSGSTALPASPINCVMRDPYNEGTWYVGTDVGAFMTTNYGVSWANMNPLGIGNVHVNAFAIPPDKSYLYVATFGRGIWRIPIKSVTFTNFTVSASSVYGDRTLTGTITLSDPAPPSAVATITDGSSYVTVPSSVTVSKGSSTKAFTITTLQRFGSSVSATVYVSCLGTLRSATFTILPYPTVSTLGMSPSSVRGGTSSTATATLSAAAPFSGTVSFTDNSTAVSAPGNATINAGASTRAVSVPTVSVTSTTTATITATYKGTSRTATLTVTP